MTSKGNYEIYYSSTVPGGSQGRFLWNVWQKRVHHCNLESSGSHSMPARKGD